MHSPFFRIFEFHPASWTGKDEDDAPDQFLPHIHLPSSSYLLLPALHCNGIRGCRIHDGDKQLGSRNNGSRSRGNRDNEGKEKVDDA